MKGIKAPKQTDDTQRHHLNGVKNRLNGSGSPGSSRSHGRPSAPCVCRLHLYLLLLSSEEEEEEEEDRTAGNRESKTKKKGIR